MANLAFETTVDDVLVVCKHRLNRDITEDQAEAILSSLDCDKIEREALDGGCDLDDQTASAYDEIVAQMNEKGL